MQSWNRHMYNWTTLKCDSKNWQSTAPQCIAYRIEALVADNACQGVLILMHGISLIIFIM